MGTRPDKIMALASPSGRTVGGLGRVSGLGHNLGHDAKKDRSRSEGNRGHVFDLSVFSRRLVPGRGPGRYGGDHLGYEVVESAPGASSRLTVQWSLDLFSRWHTSRDSASDSAIALWDTVTGPNLSILHGHGGNVTSIRFSPDSHLLASSGTEESGVIFWGCFLRETTPNPEAASPIGAAIRRLPCLFTRR